MARYAAFFRAINVGGRNIAMADLRAELTAMGYENVTTILQSGTAIVESAKTAASVERDLESGLRRAFRLDTSAIVRTGAQIGAALDGNPFTHEAEKDAAHLVAVLLKATPPAEGLEALRRAIPGRERVEAGQDVLYIYYPDGIGDSKLTAAFIDRKLGTIGTGRNWNTMRKIADALER